MRHARFIWYGSEALEAPRPTAGAKTRGGRKEALSPKNGRCVHFSSMPALSGYTRTTTKKIQAPFASLPIGMVSQVLLEYMHLVCLGVMKKLLSAWVSGSFTFFSKLPALNTSVISTRLNSLARYCPLDFARRPRAIEKYCKYKATEFRQFLLYTGSVVLYGGLNDEIYKSFLILQAAIMILVSESPSSPHLRFAESALGTFVLRDEELYGPTFNSY